MIKGDQAVRLFGEKGKDGVVAITTKAFREMYPVLKEVVVGPKATPLYIIDGVEMPDDALQKLNPNDIASISVLKDAAAMAVYGDKGVKGVILITTKKDKKQD